MSKRIDFGASQVITTANTGAITHQIPAIQKPRYLDSVVASIALAALAGSNGFVMSTFFVCIGSPLTQTDVDALDFNSDIPQILGGKVASVLYQHIVAGPGTISSHLGDVPNGPLLIPPGSIITAGFTRSQTGAPLSPACVCLATLIGWDVEIGVNPLYGRDPRLREGR